MTTENGLKTELKMVMFADVAGYTRLTEANEADTHRALRDSLQIVSKLIAAHHGKVAHTAGDAVLADFSSVMNGINCAVAIQKSMAKRNESQTDLPRIQFRIGIDVGDVILDEGEIYGETVNTAVRLQTAADQGGICISEAAHNAIGRRLPFACEFIGDERLKNMSVPVRAYRVVMEAGDKGPVEIEIDGKPSIAVMPFENLGDKKFENIVDSFTEDLIRELSRFHGFYVIAHHSTFAYKGRSARVKRVARELGAAFVAEGNLRIDDEHLRANVQLIDALADRHIWSEIYHWPLEAYFGAPNDTIRVIVAAIAGRLHTVCSDAALHRPTDGLRAFEHVLRGQALVGKGAESNARARFHYQRALGLDPGCARALTGIALGFVDDWWNGWTDDPDETLSFAFNAAMQAYRGDITDSKVHWVLGLVHLLRSEIEQAARLVSRAIEINRNDADSYAVQALVSICNRNPDAASEAISTALMLNPFPSAWYRWIEGVSYFASANIDEARYVLLEAVQQNPELIVAKAFLIAVYAELDDREAACLEAKALLRQNPGVTARSLVRRMPVFNESDRDRLVAAFTEANIPE